MLTITPFLWFKDDAEAAVSHYTSIFNRRLAARVRRRMTLEGL